ncbi:MAG TPA: hypothetical protein VIV11_32130 [Kofleriaceae bacterium]
MALRKLLGCLSVAALVCALTACKDKDAAKNQAALDKRCEQLAKACGDKDKHSEKLVSECKQAAKKQAEKGCTDKATAAYDCYEKELCGAGDKVWALDDLRVLTERHKKCVAERDASHDCTEK